MGFSDHKINEFTHRIADLPDQPALSPEELKARFDSSPEELRQAHNALCSDAARLDERVSGIVAQTFGDTIVKSMLSAELAAELDAKAEAADLTGEITARQALAETVAQKCEVFTGIYTGDGEDSQLIELGFTPQAVLVTGTNGLFNDSSYYYGGFSVQDGPANALKIEEGGFRVYYSTSGNRYKYTNTTGQHYFLAFK